jgi:sugar phosphate isomerase/epimerase
MGSFDQPLFGISQEVLPHRSVESDFDLTVDAGVDALVVLGRSIDQLDAEATRKLLDERSLVASGYGPDVEVLAGDDAQARAVLETNLRVAAALGAPNVVVTSGPRGTASVREADQMYVRRLRSVSALAVALDVRMVIEPLHPIYSSRYSYVHGLDHAADIASEVEHCGILLDVKHVYWERRLIENIAEYASLIHEVHLVDLSPTDLQEGRFVFAPPGEGVIPIEEVIVALRQADYRGYYESEYIPPPAVRGDPSACLAAIQSTKAWFESLWT